MKLEWCVISDVGKRRQNNEDNFYINGLIREHVEDNHVEYKENLENQDLLGGIFDGMGGEENGEYASLEAAGLLKRYKDSPFVTICEQYVDEANYNVCEMMQIMDSGRMGSTLAIVQIHDGKMNLCNVGDSPVYLWREGKLQQLSVNHNEAQRMYDMGIITKEEIKSCKQKNRLTQHLGIYADEMIIEPYCKTDIALAQGDYILLCSDGLTDMVEDEQVEKMLRDNQDVQEAARQLVCAALDHGGRDNITVLLVRVVQI